MARTTKPLTNTEIKQAKPREKEYSLMDGEGLKLRIKPNGSKLWLFNYYRPHTKKRANLSFGTFPDVSLALARTQRKQARELLAKEIDPKEHRDEHQHQQQLAHNNTLEHIAGIWFEVKRSGVTDDHATGIWRSLCLHVFPELGKLPIHKITGRQAIEALKPVEAKGSLETVKRVCQRLNEVMTFAVNTGITQSNPLAGIGKAFQTPAKNNMPALAPEELPRLMIALSTASIKRTTRCLIEWQLHTMTRPNESAGARWDEIDIEAKLWNIPAERMKQRLGHVVPLSSQSLALLEVMRPISGRYDHVFPGDRNPNRATNNQTANAALKRMGFHGQLVAHGMRSIASTTLNGQGVDSDVIEAALAHVIGNEVRRAYNRSDYLERRRVLMAWWSNHIEQAATGSLSLAEAYKTLKAV